MTNVEGSRNILSTIIRQVAALNKPCGEAQTKPSDPRQLNMEEHSGDQETPTRESNASSISPRYVVEQPCPQNQAQTGR